MTLPASSAVFVGRDAELAHIARLLSDPACRLLTLVGPGGIGKTRLAIEAGRQQPAPERVYFVPLQPVSAPDSIVTTIAEAIGFQFYPGGTPRQQLLDFLRAKPWILILDNFEHLLDGAGLLPDILTSAPDVRLLVTSRERLNLVEEWALEIGGLAYAISESDADAAHFNAVELFIQRAMQAKVGFALTEANHSSVNRICRLVGGMPLGIELAATWIRALSCQQIAEEIERSLDILETAMRNVEPRHRTIRAVFEPTWERLSERERDVFMRLSVFRGGFTREAAKSVAGASLRTLSALMDKSLLRVDAKGRYDLHELLRQYAEEQLKAADEVEAMSSRHSAYYAAFLRERWQPLRNHQQVKTLDEIEVEFENIHSAWQTMVAMRNCAELSMSVYSLWYFADLRGRYPKALALFKQAEDGLRPLAGDQDMDRVIGQMLTRRGWFYADLGKLGEGRALASEGLALLRRAGSPEDVALALYSLCNVAAYALDWQAVKQYAEQMAQIARRMDDRWLLAGAHFGLANAAIYTDHLEEAKQFNEEGLALAEACGDLFQKAVLRATRSAIAQTIGDYVVVNEMLEQALKLHEELRHAAMIGDLHREIGINAFRVHEYARAATHYLRALELLADSGGYELLLFSTLRDIAALWAALERKEQAVELLSLILHHPKPLPYHRDEAENMLRPLKSELPPHAFAAARERGIRLDLDTLVQELITELSQLAQAPVTAVAATGSQRLADPLTAREVEILRLVGDGFTNREIAEQLVLAQSTIKWYVNQVFGKLGATNRTQAVARARALGLLT